MFAVEVAGVALNGSDSKCLGASCSCAKVPSIIRQLEQHKCEATKAPWSALSEALCIALCKLAAVLLEGGHSGRAFRRTSEAFDG